MKSKLIFLFCILGYFGAKAQKYPSPMDIQNVLSASFAELRPNHFHAGLDISTGGVIGVPVKSVADGRLADIAPTMLTLMGIPQPAEMTGKSLISF